MELRVLTNHLQDLCHQGLAQSEVVLTVSGCVSDLLVVQATQKSGEPVILIGDKDEEFEDLS